VSLTLGLLVAYAALLIAAGLVVARRVRGSAAFFVAGRALSPGLLFATLLAANIGAGSTVGATGLGYRFGWWAWWWSGSAALGCLALGLWVAPRLHRIAAEHGHLTVGDFLEARFDRTLRGLVGATLWAGTLLILAGQIIAMAWAFGAVAGVPKSWGCVLSALVLVAYFSGGGLLASAWVNLLELAVLLVGFALALPFVWSAAGGWSGLAAASAGVGGTGPMPAPMLVGLVVTLVPSFIVSPGLVQKTWGARTPEAARGATVLNAAALALFACLPVLLGLAARRLRPDLANPELALPVLLAEVLPPWVGALGLAALFAAEISTADAVLFMLATSLGKDLYKTFVHPQADDARLLRVGRWASVAAGAAGLLLALFLPTVVGALKAFYGILTVALFVPLIVGLYSARPTAGQAKAAVLAAVGAMLALRAALDASPHVAWLPYAGATALALAIMLVPRRAARGGAGHTIAGKEDE
jgi:SSS family solute:Na+ symporter